jgi:hypothetical protein
MLQLWQVSIRESGQQWKALIYEAVRVSIRKHGPQWRALVCAAVLGIAAVLTLAAVIPYIGNATRAPAFASRPPKTNIPQKDTERYARSPAAPTTNGQSSPAGSAASKQPRL